MCLCQSRSILSSLKASQPVHDFAIDLILLVDWIPDTTVLVNGYLFVGWFISFERGWVFVRLADSNSQPKGDDREVHADLFHYSNYSISVDGVGAKSDRNALLHLCLGITSALASPSHVEPPGNKPTVDSDSQYILFLLSRGFGSSFIETALRRIQDACHSTLEDVCMDLLMEHGPMTWQDLTTTFQLAHFLRNDLELFYSEPIANHMLPIDWLIDSLATRGPGYRSISVPQKVSSSDSKKGSPK